MNNLNLDNLQKLNKMKDDYSYLSEMLTYEEVLIDHRLCLHLQKEKQSIESIVIKYLKFIEIDQNIQEFLRFHYLFQQISHAFNSYQKCGSIVYHCRHSRHNHTCYA